MRNKDFDKIFKEAIILDAEEQGARMEPSAEPIPETAQARFDAALNGTRKEPERTIDNEPSVPPQPVKRAHRWLAYGLTAVSATAVVLVVALFLGSGFRRTKAPEAPAEQPPMQAETTMAPQSEPEPESEPGEPLPYAHATFTDENAAIVAMMRFYEENRTLLMAVAADLKAPEHGEIENGVVYPIKDNGLADLDHPYASTTDSIKAFLDLPDSGDYVLFWDDSIFHVSLRWTNDSGYYSTNLVFAEDGQRIVKMMYEKQGVILEPVCEDSAWGVYTVCWRKAPYYHDSSYALGPETGVWETDDVPFLYLELFDDGTARILERFGDADTRAHYAWDMTSRNIVLLTFSDQTVVRTAELNTDTDAMTLMLADGSTVEATRAEGVVPDDPERPDLHLFTKEWQGYTCLFPETFEIRTVESQKLSATEEALLKLDMEALQTVGLTDMDYYLVAESMLNGQDLLTWYLEADGWDDKPEDFDTAESVEIAPGIVSVHYYNRNYDSYICIAKLNTIGTNTLFLAASSMTKAGTADFDGIAKQFVTVNGDFASSDTGILNEKYGKSKVFTGDGYQITLTEQFSEQKSEMGFDGYYTSYFGAVMIKIEPFTLKDGLADETVTEYIANVIKNNKTDAKPEEEDGLVFYRYQRDGMCGWNFAFKGEKAFYLVQFLCREADESELEELFFSIAKTIKVEGSERWNA